MSTVTRADDFARLRAASFKGRAKRLEDIDLPRIGHRIGVGEDEIHAFMDVECRGSGFDGSGRPKALFEPHVFYRNLPEGPKRDRAVRSGLAYPKWGTKPYPADSYPRIVQAMEIDETAALKATSWGLGQVLGENHVDAGYDSPQAMVVAFCADEENHLDAMVNFLVANRLDDDLREYRWEALARGYNGPGYAKNGYHLKLPAAFARWQKIKDTPWTPDEPAAVIPPPPDIEPIPVAIIGDDAISQPASSGFFVALKTLLEAAFGRK